MRALWVGLKSTVRCAIGRADQARILVAREITSTFLS